MTADFPAAPLAPGARLGPYVLGPELGRGGMGMVFRAQDVRLQRDVALKILPGATDAASLDAFLREARAAARLKHPGIVVVYGAEVIGGVRTVALELVEGGSLQARIARQGPFLPREAAALVADLAAAVEAAHREGVVHRDLKPANVLLDRGGRPRLTDFGLARDERNSLQTREGDVIGTPAYMAPEQARGDVDRIGPRTDVYGLGAVLFECLAGEPPFKGTSALEVLDRLVREPAPTPSSVRARRGLEPAPLDLDTICTKCLEKAPERRYATAAALEDDLRRWIDGRPIRARPPGALERAVRAVRGTRGAALAALVVVVAVGGALGGSELLRRARRRAQVEGVFERVAAARGERVAREDLLLELLATKDDETARLLAARLDRVTDELLTVTREALLPCGRAKGASEEARQDRVRDLEGALARWRALAPGAALSREDALAIDEARRRLEERLVLSGDAEVRSSDRLHGWLAQRQRERVGEGGLLASELACEALARVGFLERAIPALGAHVLALEDPGRAAAATEALVRIGTPRATWFVLRARERFGRESTFADRVERFMKAQGVAPANFSSSDLSPLDRAELRDIVGEHASAIAELSPLIERDPRDAVAWYLRAHARRELADHERAIADYSRAIELDPERAEYWHDRGIARSRSGDQVGAEKDCTRSIELDPRSPFGYNARGVARLEKGDPQDALADLARACELDPRFATAFLNRSLARRTIPDWDGALADANRCVELQPQNGWARAIRGETREEKGDLDGASADYTRAVELDPRDARCWMSRAAFRTRRGDWSGAVADLTRAIDVDSKNVEAYYRRGAARRELRELEAARADLDRACELGPSNFMAFMFRARFFMSEQQPERALQDLDRCVELKPDDAALAAHRAQCRLTLGDARGAIADATRAVEKDPKFAHAWMVRGDARSQLGDQRGAVADLTRALQLTPSDVEVRVRRAEAYVRAGDVDAAVTDATAVLEIDPRHVFALNCRATAYAARGESERAIRDLEKAAAYVPDPRAKEILRQRIADLRGR